MAQPYVGEIRMFAGNFAPAGWMFCSGQLLPISDNETLFNLIGTTYGGDGQTTFALPQLQSRVPVHQGNGFVLAQSGGVETVTLTTNQMAAHSHPFLGTSSPAGTTNPQGAVLAVPTASIYNAGTNPVGMNAGVISGTGGSQPHSNIQPYGCLNYIISLFGIFPSQT